MPIYNALIVFS